MKAFILAILLLPSLAFATPICEGLFSGYPQFSDLREDQKQDFESIMLGLRLDISFAHYDRLVNELNMYEVLFENSDEFSFEFKAVKHGDIRSFRATVTKSYLEELGRVLHFDILDVESGEELDKIMLTEKTMLESPIYTDQFGQPSKKAILHSKYGHLQMTGALIVALAEELLGKDLYSKKYDSDLINAFNKAYSDYVRHNSTGRLVNVIADYLSSQPSDYVWKDALEYNTLYLKDGELIIEGRYFNTRVDLNKYDPQKPKFYFVLDGKKSSLQINPRSTKLTGEWSTGKQWQILFDLELFIQEMLENGQIQGD